MERCANTEYFNRYDIKLTETENVIANFENSIECELLEIQSLVNSIYSQSKSFDDRYDFTDIAKELIRDLV